MRYAGIKGPFHAGSAQQRRMKAQTFPRREWVDGCNYILRKLAASRRSAPNQKHFFLEADPEFPIVAPCGYDLKRAVAELPIMENYPAWHDLRAVREGKAFFADGNFYFNRSGMTVVIPPR